MKATINVSKNSIRYADMCNIHNCVIARAMSESLPLATDVYVGINRGHITDTNGNFYEVNLPKHIEKYIVKMINMEGIIPKSLRWIFFHPFSFEMEVPDSVVAMEPVTLYGFTQAGIDEMYDDLKEKERNKELCVK